jgi:hypothetical protein
VLVGCSSDFETTQNTGSDRDDYAEFRVPELEPSPAEISEKFDFASPSELLLSDIEDPGEEAVAEEAPAQVQIPPNRDVVVRNFAWGDSEKIISKLHPNLIKDRTDNGIYVVLDAISDLNEVSCVLQLFLYEDQLFKIRFSRYGENKLGRGGITFSTLGGSEDIEREYFRHRNLNDLLEEKYDSPDEREYFTDKPLETSYPMPNTSKFYSGYVCEELIWNRPNTIITSYYLLGDDSEVPGKVTWRHLAYEWKSEVTTTAIGKAKKAAKEDAATKKEQQKSNL